jgi:hypothetical protein
MMDLKNKTLTIAATLSLGLNPPLTWAGEKEQLLELKNTVLNLMDVLVDQGVLSKEKKEALVKQAEDKAATETSSERVPEAAPALPPAVAEEIPPPTDGKTVRVQYVPEFVKDEIRAQVRAELKQDVVADVMSHAKHEKWGLPGALPEWISKVKWHGDVRLRDQLDLFGDANALNTYPDFLAINRAGGIGPASKSNRAFFNTTKDRNRWRVRARFGMDVDIAENLKFGARLITNNQVADGVRTPVSLNQTLGTYGQDLQVVLDQLFLRYDDKDLDGYPWLTMWGGRFPNPWHYTDLVWDDDLNFHGIAATFRHNLTGSGSLLDMQDRSSTLFMTLGAFPLQEVELSSRDKWLLGGQIGHEKVFDNQTKATVSLAYYDYLNITGRRNDTPDGVEQDFTAPDFMQRGNTLFDIRNDTDPDTNRFALASDYNLLNLTAKMDFAQFSPYHVILTGDVVKNLGYDKDEIRKRTGGVATHDIRDRTWGFHMGMTVGWPQVVKWGDWQVFAAYKYIQRDAVLDAFTDSNFHLGGTDAEGWVLGANYGLTKNTWLRARWLSADAIDGPPLGIDTLQVDLNAKF